MILSKAKWLWKYLSSINLCTILYQYLFLSIGNNIVCRKFPKLRETEMLTSGKHFNDLINHVWDAKFWWKTKASSVGQDGWKEDANIMETRLKIKYLLGDISNTMKKFYINHKKYEVFSPETCPWLELFIFKRSQYSVLYKPWPIEYVKQCCSDRSIVVKPGTLKTKW